MGYVNMTPEDSERIATTGDALTEETFLAGQLADGIARRAVIYKLLNTPGMDCPHEALKKGAP